MVYIWFFRTKHPGRAGHGGSLILEVEGTVENAQVKGGRDGVYILPVP